VRGEPCTNILHSSHSEWARMGRKSMEYTKNTSTKLHTNWITCVVLFGSLTLTFSCKFFVLLSSHWNNEGKILFSEGFFLFVCLMHQRDLVLFGAKEKIGKEITTNVNVMGWKIMSQWYTLYVVLGNEHVNSLLCSASIFFLFGLNLVVLFLVRWNRKLRTQVFFVC